MRGASLRRRLSVAALVAVTGSLLAACQGSDFDANQVRADLARTASQPRAFVWINQTLVGGQTVTGEYQDPYRYHVLYSAAGKAGWEEIVRDDAVADRFLDAGVVAAYVGAYDHNQLLGSDPNRPAVPFAALGPPSGPNAAAVAALQARHWVLDATGAPSVPTPAQLDDASRTDPFYGPLLYLTTVRQLIDQAPDPKVRRWRKDDVYPVYKPANDPFPPPPPGWTRYDVYQTPLPQLQSNSPGDLPLPPTPACFAKVAIYVHGGMVEQIREVVDPLDHLQDVLNNYHLKIPPNLSRQEQEAYAQGVISGLMRGTNQAAFRVEQITWVASNLGRPVDVTLPTDAVAANLTAIPGRGAHPAST